MEPTKVIITGDPSPQMVADLQQKLNERGVEAVVEGSPEAAAPENEAPSAQEIAMSELPARLKKLLTSTGTYRVGPNRGGRVSDFTKVEGPFLTAMNMATGLQASSPSGKIHYHVEDLRTTKVLFDTARHLPKAQARKNMAVPLPYKA